jgi:hypothetical protein
LGCLHSPKKKNCLHHSLLPSTTHLTAYSWHPKWQILEPPKKATNLRYPKPGNWV